MSARAGNGAVADAAMAITVAGAPAIADSWDDLLVDGDSAVMSTSSARCARPSPVGEQYDEGYATAGVTMQSVHHGK